jgi:hypothetical protein
MKHVEFYSKNKFEKLVHLVGFITGIYHDARSHERRIKIPRAFRNFRSQYGKKKKKKAYKDRIMQKLVH